MSCDVPNDAFRTLGVLNASFTTFTITSLSPRRRNDIHSDHACPIRPVRIYSPISPGLRKSVKSTLRDLGYLKVAFTDLGATPAAPRVTDATAAPAAEEQQP